MQPSDLGLRGRPRHHPLVTRSLSRARCVVVFRELPAVVRIARWCGSEMGTVVANYRKRDANGRRECSRLGGFIAYLADRHLKTPASGRRMAHRDVNHLLHARIVIGNRDRH